MKRPANSILILSLLCLFATASFQQCKKKEKKSHKQATGMRFPKKYQGTYRLEPAIERTVIHLNEKGVALYKTRTRAHHGSYMIHRGVLHIFFHLNDAASQKELSSSMNPSGVFLLDDFDPAGWKGRWTGDAAEIIRTSSPL